MSTIILANNLHYKTMVIIFSIISVSHLIVSNIFKSGVLLKVIGGGLVALLAYPSTQWWNFCRSDNKRQVHSILMSTITFIIKMENTIIFQMIIKSMCSIFGLPIVPFATKTMNEVEQLSLKMKGNPRVNFALLNLPIEKDLLGKANEILKRRGMSLTTLCAKNIDSLKTLGIESVPLYLIVRNDTILETFNGCGTCINKQFVMPTFEERIQELLTTY
jgi:hypothetical protein